MWTSFKYLLPPFCLTDWRLRFGAGIWFSPEALHSCSGDPVVPITRAAARSQGWNPTLSWTFWQHTASTHHRNQTKYLLNSQMYWCQVDFFIIVSDRIKIHLEEQTFVKHLSCALNTNATLSLSFPIHELHRETAAGQQSVTARDWLKAWNVPGRLSTVFLRTATVFVLLSAGVLHSCGHVVSGLHIWWAPHPETSFPWKIWNWPN